MRPNQVTGLTQFIILIDDVGQDFGDAPAPFPTLQAAGGARHVIYNSDPLYIGATVDRDVNGQPSATADGDDTDADGNDDDGITFRNVLNEFVITPIEVVTSAAGFLDAWIDYNDDGDWTDPNEQIFNSVALVSGLNTVDTQMPAGFAPTGADDGKRIARFRFSSTGSLQPTGLAIDGEVEDYEVTLVPGSPPTTTPDDYSTDEDTLLFIPNATMDGLLSNDTDPEGDPITVGEVNGSDLNLSSLLTLDSGATLVVQDDGSFDYDPRTSALLNALAVGESATDTFTYRAIDAPTCGPPCEPIFSVETLVTITVFGVNDAPVVQDVAGINAVEDGVTVDGAFDGDDVDSDDDGSTLVYTITSVPAEGSVTNNSDGTFTFDPGADFQDLAVGETRDVTFMYRATDSHAAMSNTGTITVTVTGVNDGPTAVDGTASAVEDGPAVTGTFPGDDVDSDDSQSTLIYVITSLPAEGTVTNNNDGTYSFAPGSAFQDLALGETRSVSFTYTATDMHGVTTPNATITVTVTGVNDAPVAMDMNITAIEDGPAVLFPFNADDIDSDDHPGTLDYTIVTTPSEGSVAENGNGTFTFNPGTMFQDLAAGETRDVTFTYTATDQHLAVSHTGTVTVTVTGVNDKPVAQTVTGVNAVEDGPAVMGSFDADDVDSDNTPANLSYVITRQPTEGSAANNLNGTFSFNPGSGFQNLAVGENRTVSFDYRATDRHGAASNTAMVLVDVTGVNDAPTASNISFSISEDGPPVTRAFNGNDIDSDDSPSTLTYTFTNPAQGTVTNNNDGTFTFDPGTDFDDLPNGMSRTTTFTYRATDQHTLVSNQATVTITVIGVNDGPTASDINITATEDGPIVANVPFAATDPDSPGALTYSITSSPAEGSATNNGDGTFNFNPGAGFQDLAVGEKRTVSFTYVASDNQAAVSNTGTVFAEVTGVNDNPTVSTVSIGAMEDGVSVIGSFIGNDVDSDDVPPPLTFSIVTFPPASQGTINNNNNGTFTYNPGSNFQSLSAGQTTVVAIPYRGTDSHNAPSADGLVNVTVTGTNDAPTTANVTAAAMEDGTPVTASFSASDVDSENSTPASFTYTILTSPAEGTVTNLNNGLFTFAPGSAFQDLNQGQNRVVSFTYRVADLQGAVSNTSTATITVTGVNDAPSVQNVNLNAAEDGGAVTGVFNADDIDNEDSHTTLVYTIPSQPAEGTAALHPTQNGSFRFDPGMAFQDLAAGQNRVVTFPYSARDMRGVTRNGLVTVTVTGVNDPPVAMDMTIQAVEDGPGVTFDFPGDDVDSDNDQANLTYTILSQPSEGSVVNNGNRTFTFNPGTAFQDLAAGATRSVTLTYRATDAQMADSNTGTITVNVTGVNDAPVVSNVSISAMEDGGPVTGNFVASDVDGNVMTYATTQPSAGSVTHNNATGQFTFDPGTAFQDLGPGATRIVQFTYTANDGTDTSLPATVTVTVTGTNDAPIANADMYLVNEDTRLVVAGEGVIENDTDVDRPQQLLRVVNPGSLTSSTLGVAIEMNADGTFRYDPTLSSTMQALAQGATVTDTFTYQITDGVTPSNATTASIRVSGINDAPRANPMSIALMANAAPSVHTFNADDVDSDDSTTSLDYTFVSLPAFGSVMNHSDGTFTFSLDGDFDDLAVGQNRIVSFTYRATDQHLAASEVQQITVTVTGVNDTPTATDNAYPTNESTVISGNVLVNGTPDSDPDNGDVLRVSAVNGNAANVSQRIQLASGALLSVLSNGLFDYDPRTSATLNALAVGEIYSDSFTYTVSDGHGGTDQATVSVTVNGVNDPPVITLGTFTTMGNVPFTFDPIVNVMDPDTSDVITINQLNGQPATVGTQITLDSGATVTVGSITYDPTTSASMQGLSAGETATETFTFGVSDGNGGTSVGSVTITIVGVNDAPVASPNEYFTTEDSVRSANVITDNTGDGVDTDVDGDAVTVLQVNGSAANVGVLATLPNGAALRVNSDGTFTYDASVSPLLNALAEGAVDNSTFTYTISDGNGETSTATVTVTVTGVNDTPTATPNSYVTDEDTALLDRLVVMDDSDPDSANLTLTKINGTPVALGTPMTLPSGARVIVTVNATTSATEVDYDPTTSASLNALSAGSSDIDSFTYEISDGYGGVDTAEVTVTVNGVNDVPLASDNGFVTDEDSAIDGNVTDYDTDVDTLDTITVTAVNGLAANVDTPFTTPLGATVQVDADGAFHYDPRTSTTLNALRVGQSQTESLSYTVSDGVGGTDTATVTVLVTGVNDAPEASDNAYATSEDAAVSGNLITDDTGDGVDADDDNDSLRVASVNGSAVAVGSAIILPGTGATLTVALNGGFTYDPTTSASLNALAAGATAQDTFTYAINDGNGGVSTASVTITVTGVNDAPVAVGDSNATGEDDILNVVGVGVLENDSDPDGDAITVKGDSFPLMMTSAFGATVSMNQNGTFTYDPTHAPMLQSLSPNEFRNDSFTYTITDGSASSNAATVVIVVTGAQDAPTAHDDSYSTNANATLVVPSANGWLANDTDPENKTLTVTTASGSTGLALWNANGGFTFNPSLVAGARALDVGESMVEVITYTMSDGTFSDSATVEITIHGVNDAPQAVGDSYNAVEDSVLTVSAPGVLANDTDPEGHSLSITSFSNTSSLGAVITLTSNGALTYDPSTSTLIQSLREGQTTTDTFNYTVSDGSLTSSAAVSITVSGADDPAWQNQNEQKDVNGDGFISPIDALLIINYINNNGMGTLPDPPPVGFPPPFVDVNGDGDVNAGDVIIVINFLNDQGNAEGESEGKAAAAAVTLPPPTPQNLVMMELGSDLASRLRYVDDAMDRRVVLAAAEDNHGVAIEQTLAELDPYDQQDSIADVAGDGARSRSNTHDSALCDILDDLV